MSHPHPLPQGHILAEVMIQDNEDLISKLGAGEMLHTLVPHQLSACMMIHGAKHPQVN